MTLIDRATHIHSVVDCENMLVQIKKYVNRQKLSIKTVNDEGAKNRIQKRIAESEQHLRFFRRIIWDLEDAETAGYSVNALLLAKLA